MSGSSFTLEAPPDTGGTIGGGGTPTPSPTPTPAPAPTPAPSPVPPAPPPPTSSILPAIVASALRSGHPFAVSAIPIEPVPAQTFTVQLGEQNCQITIYQKRTGLYLDLFADGVAIGVGILCHDRVWLIRDAYLGFTGDLSFIDTQATDDPDYTGLGARFVLVWGH